MSIPLGGILASVDGTRSGVNYFNSRPAPLKYIAHDPASLRCGFRVPKSRGRDSRLTAAVQVVDIFVRYTPKISD
jgi:hypothetical protein